ncbi:MAG: hypothetical protein M9895_00580 [Aquamicrobium sp.]|uniref:hypothetical protein n=1 Tax=Aquamicrobium sp. TaxID=1872579 RepID=UPI00349E8F59|nr:hypothetical protein [Aquamicrobium sp.]MCO5156564.1 hypothetical protein [Aquamicrobium sp.]
MSEAEPGHAALAVQLSGALKELHRALIRSEIGDDPALQNPYTMLFALIGDPRFAWMGPLSQLIARIDQQVADEEIGDADILAALHGEVAGLTGAGLTGGKGDATFRMRHVMALQKEPEVGLATGRLRKVLAKLPPLPEPE